MNLLTATGQGQGHRPGDFNDGCVEGELVMPVMACVHCEVAPDPGCACARAFIGMSSDALTTTAMVRDLPGFGLPDYAEAIGAWLDRIGGRTPGGPRAADLAAGLADAFPYSAGAVVQRQGREVSVRLPAT